MLTRKPTNPIMSLAACSLALAISQLAHAHSVGHGPTILGNGSHGGSLTAIVSAVEAELGEKAQARGIAEWIKKGSKLTIYLWDEKKEKTISIPSSSEIKWIVMGQKMPEPEVIKMLVEKPQANLVYSFEPKLLENADSIEVILPNLREKQEKHVFVMKLK